MPEEAAGRSGQLHASGVRYGFTRFIQPDAVQYRKFVLRNCAVFVFMGRVFAGSARVAPTLLLCGRVLYILNPS